MKDKYAEMIKAKADNSELVLLVYSDSEWIKSVWNYPQSNDAIHFMCYPKHVEACLHVLNGGEAHVKGVCHERGVRNIDPTSWSKGSWYMCETMESRIKPKKEKRHIVVGTCPLEANESDWCLAFADHNEAEKFCEEANMSGFKSKVIEIEIEVE